MKNIGILGYGREGQATLSFLKKDKAYKNATFFVLDKIAPTKKISGATVITGEDYLDKLEEFDIVFRTPGIPYLLPQIQRAKKNGVIISSLTKLFFERCPAQIIGVTGTKGKGTTATLIYNILKAAKKDVYLAGNIGVPALTLLPKVKKSSIVVLELSSFQLQDLEASPEIAVVLDMFPDHQDAHTSLKEYYAAKSSITRYQNKNCGVFFYPDNTPSKAIATKSAGKKIPVRTTGFILFSQENLKIKGYHSFKNAVMATAVAKSIDIPDSIIRKTILAFRGNEHRLEFVKTVSGIHFYNDSASTTPDSSAAAIRAFPGEHTVIMMGGKDKNLDCTPLLRALQSKEGQGVEAIVLVGENVKKIQAALSTNPLPIFTFSTLKEATEKAYQVLKSDPMDIPKNVVYSPGATSFDMFTNYAERGTTFKSIVKNL